MTTIGDIKARQSPSTFQSRRTERGTSDKSSLECHCPQTAQVLLFYRYFPSHPRLHTQKLRNLLRDNATSSDDDNNLLWKKAVNELAIFQETLCRELHITGKIRVGIEGINGTIVGESTEISEYIVRCQDHWSFDGLDLTSEAAQLAFFKPTKGCKHAFEGQLSVKIVKEITPFGQHTWLPNDWLNNQSCTRIEYLSPKEFHNELQSVKCRSSKSTLVLDARNHYESNIGYFAEAHCPPIRRFSSLPYYLQTQDRLSSEKPDRVLTYCTGGIRCEKAARWIAEQDSVTGTTVATLKGGIHAYLEWFQQQCSLGVLQPNECLFLGRNFVFDARGSIGLSLPEAQTCVSSCLRCARTSSNLTKCPGLGCHLVIVGCETCLAQGSVWCCDGCKRKQLSIRDGRQLDKTPCTCELTRLSKLQVMPRKADGK